METKAKAKCPHCEQNHSFTRARLKTGLWPCCGKKLTTEEQEEIAGQLDARKVGSVLLNPQATKAEREK